MSSALGTYLGQVGITPPQYVAIQNRLDEIAASTQTAATRLSRYFKQTFHFADSSALNTTVPATTPLEPGSFGRHVTLFGRFQKGGTNQTANAHYVEFMIQYATPDDTPLLWYNSGNRLRVDIPAGETTADFSMELTTAAPRMRLIVTGISGANIVSGYITAAISV